MGISQKHLRIAAQHDQVIAAVEFVADSARVAGLDEEYVHHCALAVDEACSNIIEHGYGAGAEQQPIDVTCQEELSAFIIIIIDQAPAFNPLARPEPDPNTPLEQRGDGGWGVAFIRRIMDETSYQHQNGQNMLTLVKNLDPARKYIIIQMDVKHVVIIGPHGDLDQAFSRRLELVLAREINAGNKYLLVDLSGVSEVTGSGLKVLVSMWQRAREKKGDIVLVGLNAIVQEAMSLTGFDLVFSIYPTADVALTQHKYR